MIRLCFLCRGLIFKWKPDKLEIKTKDKTIRKSICPDCACIIEGLKQGVIKNNDEEFRKFDEKIKKHDSI